MEPWLPPLLVWTLLIVGPAIELAASGSTKGSRK